MSKTAISQSHLAQLNQWLRNAVVYCREQEIKLLLEEGADIHKHDIAILETAVDKGCTSLVRMLLDAGAPVKHAYIDPLANAASKGYTPIVRMLLDAGADSSYSSYASLRLSAQEGYLEIVKMLLHTIKNYRPNIDLELDYALKNAIENAVQKGHIEIVEMFLNKGVSVTDEFASAIRAALLKQQPEMMKILLDAGANGHTLKDTPPHLLKMWGITPDTLNLLENYQPENPDEVIDELGRTKLMEVALHGPTYKLREFLRRTQNINKQDNLGNTALIYAVQSNDPLQIKEFMNTDADMFLENYGTADIPGANAWEYAAASTNPIINKIAQHFAEKGELHRAMRGRQIPRDVRTLVQRY